MPIAFEHASLTIVLAGRQHTMADVSFLTENLQAITCAGIWAALISRETEGDDIAYARRILSKSLAGNRSHGRFYPRFYSILDAQDSNLEDDNFLDGEFDSSNSLDAGAIVGMNSWMRREIYAENPKLYQRLFGFGRVDRLEHHSPLVIELGIVIGGLVAVPVVLTYGLMAATAAFRRRNAEGKIREKEAEILDETIRQKRIQTQIQQELLDALRDQRRRDERFTVPDTALAAAANFASPAISELGSSPLIENLTVGLSSGGK